METMKEKIVRLEKEISELKMRLKESWEREEEQNKKIIELENGLEEQFKQTPLYKQMQREITNLRAENSLNRGHIKILEDIRGKQAERIWKLESSIKIKNNTLEIEDSMTFLINIHDEKEKQDLLDKIKIFNDNFKQEGVELYLSEHTINSKVVYCIVISYKKFKNKRGAGRKEKDVKGYYTLEEVENMIKEQGADKTSKILGISRATFFRKLKKCREWGELNEIFL